jgi:hypothetical protein
LTKTDRNRLKKITAKKLLNIESNNRLSSDSIESLSEKPNLLKEYLDFSITNTFSELMFRLTHEIYLEDKAKNYCRPHYWVMVIGCICDKNDNRYPNSYVSRLAGYSPY